MFNNNWPNIKAQLALYVWVALMASSFIISENLTQYANPIASTGLRFLLAAMLLGPFIARYFKVSLSFKIGGRYLLISLFLVLFFLGLFESLKTTSAFRTSVIYTLLPLMTVLLSYLELKIIINKWQLLGFIIGSAGACWVLLSVNKSSHNIFIWNAGDGIFLLACVSLALQVVLIKKWASNEPPIVSAFYILLFGSLLLMPLLFTFGEVSKLAWGDIAFWKNILYLTLFTTLATFMLQQYLIQKLGANHLLAFTYLIPILVLSPKLLSTPIQLWYSFPGLVLTVTALYLIARSQPLDNATLMVKK